MFLLVSSKYLHLFSLIPHSLEMCQCYYYDYTAFSLLKSNDFTHKHFVYSASDFDVFHKFTQVSFVHAHLDII